MSEIGASGGAGHGGRGGKGYFNGSWANGGKKYGSTVLPCELGSGSGNLSSEKFTVGGGVIGRNVFLYPHLTYTILSFS